MDVILIIIGVLGLGALLIAAWVFASAARRSLTGEDICDDLEALNSDLSPYNETAKHNQTAEHDQAAEQTIKQIRRPRQPRSRDDRRQQRPPRSFPIFVNGECIEKDRRQTPDRRRVA